MRYEDNLAVEQIAARTGYCVATIYKYLKDNHATDEETEDKIYDGIAAPYESIIREWLVEDTKHYYKQRNTAINVYNKLKERFPDFEPSYKTIQRLFKRIRSEVFCTKRLKKNLPSVPVGAEVTCTPFPCRIKGFKCNSFVVTMSFPFSRAAFIQVIPERSTEWILTALQNIYEHIGGVPSVHLFTSQTKLYRHRARDISSITDELLMRFIMYHGFKDDYHVPYNEVSRPSVSAMCFHYKKWLLDDVKEISDLATFNKELLPQCDLRGNRIPEFEKNTATTVNELFEQDKAKFLPLPSEPFKIVSWSKRKVDKMAMLSIDSKDRYALAPSMKNRTVFVYLTVEKIEVRNLNQDVIQTFERIYSSNMHDEIDPLHQLYLLRSKPNATLNCKIRELFPPALVEIFATSESRIKSRYINAMWEIATREGVEAAIRYAAKAAEKKITTKEEILKLL